MNPNDRDEERLAAQLAAWDELLARGDTPAPADTPDVPPELQARLDRGLECMRLLHEARPRRARNDDSFTLDYPGQGETPAGPVVLPDTVEVSPDRPASPAFPAESTIGRFQLRRELGRGGFGVVFLAYDPQLNREVALKVPRLDVLASSELRERFQQEARAAAGLDHPNIVPVYESGEIGPITYIASAYCPGVTLASWMKQRTEPVPFDTAAELTATLAEAVHHAHSRGVVHRDLKPGNVLIGNRPSAIGHRPEAANDNSVLPMADSRLPTAVKITDFGLAKLMDADVAGPNTKTGVVLGTPSYMAPEQAGGKTAALGPAVDVYALGTILYELLTGRPPFVGETDLETLLQVQNDDPLPPSRLRPKLPRDLETICLKCLQKEPRVRYESARHLSEDLERFLRQEPILARPLGVVGRTWRWCRRRPAVAALLTVLVLVVTGSLVGLASLWLLADDRAVLAEQRRDESDESLRRSLRAIERYFTIISEEELLNVDGMQPLREKLLQEAVKFYEEFLAQHRDNPRLQEQVAVAKRYLARIKSHQGRAPDSEADLRKAIERLEVLVRDHPGDTGYIVELAHAHESLGTVLSKMSRSKESLESYRETCRLLETLGPADAQGRRARSLLAVANRGLGIVLYEQGQTQDGLRAMRRALQLYETICREQPDDEAWLGLALTQQFLGSALTNQEQLDEAEKLFKEALAVHQRYAEAKNVRSEVKQQLARTLHRLGVLEFRRKNWDAALGYLQRALTMNRQLARANPHVRNYQIALLECLNAIGGVHLEAQRPLEGYVYLWQGAEVLRSTIEESPEDPYLRHQLGQHLFNLGLTLTKLNRPAEALKVFEEGVLHGKVALEAARESHSRRLTLTKHYYHISRLHRLAGRHAESAAAVRERAGLFPNDPQQLSEAGNLLAQCVPLVGSGKSTLSSEEENLRRQYADEAVHFLRRAVELGYKNVKDLKENRSLDPLRSREDFQKLVAELEKPAK